MPLFELLVTILPENMIWQRLFALLLLITSALYILQTNTLHSLTQTRTFLPALLFIIISSSLPTLQELTPSLASLPFIILTTKYIFQAFNTDKPFDSFFRAGFWLSVSTLFYFHAFGLFLLVCLAVIFYGSNRLRGITAALGGYAVPWVFYATYTFIWTGDFGNAFSPIVHIWNSKPAYSILNSYFTYAFLAILCLTILVVLLNQLNSLPVQKIRVRRFHGLLLWLLGIAILSFIAVPSSSMDLIYIAAFPLSILGTNFFLVTRKPFWPQAMLVLIMLMALLNQILGPITQL